jgi:CubicO group peptidase (beta-lactamase class C family)
MTLEIYCQEHIFKPLGIRDVGFYMDPERRERLTGMHYRSKDRKIQEGSHTKPIHVDGEVECTGGGGGYGSMLDYASTEHFVRSRYFYSADCSVLKSLLL